MSTGQPIHSTLDVVSAAVISAPDDQAAWAAYIDYCLENGPEEWAELGRRYAAADEDGRARILSERWQDWPVGAALAMRMITDFLATAAETMTRGLRGVAKGMGSVIETFREVTERTRPLPGALARDDHPSH